jgi:hypothetical protein
VSAKAKVLTEARSAMTPIDLNLIVVAMLNGVVRDLVVGVFAFAVVLLDALNYSYRDI